MMRLLLLLASLIGISIASIDSNDTHCGPAQFVCKNKDCISMAFKCDNEEDCSDGSDEIGCEVTTCSDDSHRCPGGKCIPDRWLCDGGNDCGDGSDEAASLCGNVTCPAGFFQCSDSFDCKPEDWRCDQEKNCPNGEDEEGCEYTCGEDEFKCDNGKCVALDFKCDRSDDCGDNSDEKDCSEDSCSGVGQKTCANGECIHDSWWCDGDTDCDDHSDEANCTAGLSEEPCEENSLRCDGTCYPDQWRCDGDPDCDDMTDEMDCDDQLCDSDEKRCGNATYCLKEEYFCDGEIDCINGADEANCKAIVCRESRFDCKNNNCVDEAKMCDGKDDCGNGQDEASCLSTCKEDQLDCKNGKCISTSLVCNQVDDCGNSEDESAERNCPDTNPCVENNGGCSDICLPTKDSSEGRICKCKEGFQLMDGSNTTCEDINECLQPDSCSQRCINTKGSYKCECVNGYDLVEQRFCKTINHHTAELIMSDRKALRRYQLSTKHYSLLFDEERDTGSKAMDLDVRKGKVYWATAHTPVTIYEGDIDKQERKVLIDTDIQHPQGLALDWIHGNIYIADKGKGHIQVMRLEDKSRKTLFEGEDMKSSGPLAVDPYHGWIFWTSEGSTPGIERAGMNGAHRSYIIDKDIIWPQGLTIDFYSRRIYWVDSKLHTISSAFLDGSDRRPILRDETYVTHPMGITIFEDYLYFTEHSSASVKKASRFGDHNFLPVAEGLKDPMAIQVLHVSRQPEFENRCKNNRGCSHLCLPMPVLDAKNDLGKAECACPDGMVLDGKVICVDASIDPASRPDQHAVVTQPISKDDSTKPTAGVTKKPPVPGETTEDNSPNVPYTVSQNDKDNDGLDAKQDGGKSSEGHIALITIIVVGSVGCIIAVLIFFAVRRYKKRNIKTMNFDNPVYRKTTTEDQLVVDSRSNLPQSMQPLNDDPEIV